MRLRMFLLLIFFSSRRRHTRWTGDWSSDVCSSDLPEAACTSVQFHLQVSPQDYAANWNAAQCMAGVQIALARSEERRVGKSVYLGVRGIIYNKTQQYGDLHERVLILHHDYDQCVHC